MDPSEEQPERLKPIASKKTFVLPTILIIILLLAIGGILSFFNSSSTPPLGVTEPIAKIEKSPVIENRITEQNDEAKKATTNTQDKAVIIAMEPAIPFATSLGQDTSTPADEVSDENENAIPTSETTPENNLVPAKQSLLDSVLPPRGTCTSICLLTT